MPEEGCFMKNDPLILGARVTINNPLSKYHGATGKVIAVYLREGIHTPRPKLADYCKELNIRLDSRQGPYHSMSTRCNFDEVVIIKEKEDIL